MRVTRARRQPRKVPMASPAQMPEQAPPPPVFVLLYESADDVAAKAPAQFPAHKVRLDDFHARGELLMVGTFADPPAEGSMAIFRPSQGAQGLVAGDPFVLNGDVRAWQIRQWNETYRDQR